MTASKTDPRTLAFDWDPPGPGTWEFDAAHQQRPYPASMLDWAPNAVEEGFRAGFASIGIPLDTIAVRPVHGWVYMHPVPLGGPDSGGSMPPRIVMRILFRLVPALRRRHAVARSVFADRPWNDLVDTWLTTGRSQALARHRDLSALDLDTSTDEQLASLLQSVRQAAADAYRVHFIHAAVGAAITGRFAVRTNELTGLPVDDAFEMLAGYSPATTEPLQHLDRVIAALPAGVDLDGDPATVLANIRNLGGPGAAALADYLDRFGDTIVGGESPLDPTLRELPNVIVASLRARRDPQPTRTQEYAGQRAAAARKLVPVEQRAEWDRLLADAQGVTALRDDDAGVALRLVGRSRLTLLEAGRRLHHRQIIDHPESVFDITTAETVDLLTGRKTATAADRQRTARLAAADQSPPAVLGPPEDPPDFSRFPPAVQAITEALFAYISRLDSPGTGNGGLTENGTSNDGLTGTGIGNDTATGPARVVIDIADLDRVEPGDILVTPMSTPAYNATIAGVAALVCDQGGSASHAAIMAREFGIPAVVGTQDATHRLVDGEVITVDSRTGVVMRNT